MKTKPFDLEAFKAGAPAVTRLKKQPVRYLGLLDGVKTYPLIAAIHKGKNEVLEQYTEYGTEVPDAEKDDDILMIVETREYWVNLYVNKEGIIETGEKTYTSKDDAVAWVTEPGGFDYLDTVLVYTKEVTRG